MSWKTRFEFHGLVVGCFAFPTCVVPVAPQVGGIARHAYVVTHAHWNVSVAAGAHVLLARLVRLHATNFDWPVEAMPHAHPKNAHATIAAMINMADPTMRMSLGRLTRLRIGLNPIPSVLSR